MFPSKTVTFAELCPEVTFTGCLILENNYKVSEVTR